MELRTTCPFPEHEGATGENFSVSLVNGVWQCFSRCGGGTYFTLLERLRRDPGYGPGLPEPDAAARVPVLRSLLARGFTRPMLAKWGIRWDAASGAMRLPVCNDAGDEETEIWRAPQGVEPKYRYERGFSRAGCLFGLWRLPRPLARVTLVEGPLDAVWAQEIGEPTVAILGSSLSSRQADLLRQRGVRQVRLCFDNDEAGKKATLAASALLRTEGFWVFRIPLPQRYKDIQEVPHEKLAAVLARAEVCVNGVGIIHPRYKRWR